MVAGVNSVVFSKACAELHNNSSFTHLYIFAAKSRIIQFWLPVYYNSRSLTHSLVYLSALQSVELKISRAS